MNRLVIIGNGFDLAHGLKTSYKDFIEWYWEQRVAGFVGNDTKVTEDCLCRIVIKDNYEIECWNNFIFNRHNILDKPNGRKLSGKEVFECLKNSSEYFDVSCSPFFALILQSIETKGWVDIETDFYTLLCNISSSNKTEEEKHKQIVSLNKELDFLKRKLIEYLIQVQRNKYMINKIIKNQILAPISIKDIAIGRLSEFNEWLDSLYLIPDYNWKEFAMAYGADWSAEIMEIGKFRKGYDSGSDEDIEARRQGVPNALRVPNRIMLLNFNYTDVADKYMPQDTHFPVVHIHGKQDKDSAIFGYGDELDEEYKNLERKNDNEFLRNVKSVHYLESTSYRQMLDFIESDLYQIYIMGHSCGNSDRTLLNTLFEHPNCVSVKPYYYKKDDTHDNYLEMVQNITRNFNDKKLMRDRVVNKVFCEPLG